MVQESTTFGVCSKFFDDQYGFSSKKMSSSSCVTQCLPLSIEENNAISLEDEEKEEELKRQKHEEIEAVKQKRKKRVCFDAIEDLYYLIPAGKRSKGKRKSRYKVTSTSLEKRKNKKLKKVCKENESIDTKSEAIEKLEVPRIIKIESLLNQDSKISLMMEKERTPKIESFSKSEKIKKMVYNRKPNRVSKAVLPVEFKNKIQELGVPISEVSLVIEKPLFSTDLSDKHLRFSIPMKKILNPDEFLTPHEKEILDIRDNCNRRGRINFNLIEPSLGECNIHLAKWRMNSCSSYVLLNDWKSVYKRNDLKVNMIVQLWSSRKDLNPWLALVVVPPAAS